jgi:xanthine dehydrogenase accessory factor
MAEADTGIPGNIASYTKERVLRAPADGTFTTELQIGNLVSKGEVIGDVGAAEVISQLDGILRGLIQPGSAVRKGLKIGDVDPRGEAGYCDTISEKARSLGGAVLEAVLGVYNI